MKQSYAFVSVLLTVFVGVADAELVSRPILSGYTRVYTLSSREDKRSQDFARYTCANLLHFKDSPRNVESKLAVMFDEKDESDVVTQLLGIRSKVWVGMKVDDNEKFEWMCPFDDCNNDYVVTVESIEETSDGQGKKGIAITSGKIGEHPAAFIADTQQKLRYLCEYDVPTADELQVIAPPETGCYKEDLKVEDAQISFDAVFNTGNKAVIKCNHPTPGSEKHEIVSVICVHNGQGYYHWEKPQLVCPIDGGLNDAPATEEGTSIEGRIGQMEETQNWLVFAVSVFVVLAIARNCCCRSRDQNYGVEMHKKTTTHVACQCSLPRGNVAFPHVVANTMYHYK